MSLLDHENDDSTVIEAVAVENPASDLSLKLESLLLQQRSMQRLVDDLKEQVHVLGSLVQNPSYKEPPLDFSCPTPAPEREMKVQEPEPEPESPPVRALFDPAEDLPLDYKVQ